VAINQSGVFGDTGTQPETPGESSWNTWGNVGGDIDFALSTNADVTLRPDVTFLADFTLVTTTLGFALKL
jgi:hypothetical protein